MHHHLESLTRLPRMLTSFLHPVALSVLAVSLPDTHTGVTGAGNRQAVPRGQGPRRAWPPWSRAEPQSRESSRASKAGLCWEAL